MLFHRNLVAFKIPQEIMAQNGLSQFLFNPVTVEKNVGEVMDIIVHNSPKQQGASLGQMLASNPPSAHLGKSWKARDGWAISLGENRKHRIYLIGIYARGPMTEHRYQSVRLQISCSPQRRYPATPPIPCLYVRAEYVTYPIERHTYYRPCQNVHRKSCLDFWPLSKWTQSSKG